MSSLEKFNQTLKEFDQEVSQLKEVAGAYRKLNELSETYERVNEKFEQNSSTLEKMNLLVKQQQDKVDKSLNALEELSIQHKKELSKFLEEKTDQIRKENKEFYRDFEGTIKIKLDENRSEIKQLIENERNQIRQLFEMESAKNTRELREAVEKENKKVRVLVLASAGVLLLFLAAILYRTWQQ